MALVTTGSTKAEAAVLNPYASFLEVDLSQLRINSQRRKAAHVGNRH